jgi:hypothetical protein
MAALDLRGIAAGGESPTAAAPLVGRELAINVTYTTPEGATHSGALISRILDGDKRLQRARAAAATAAMPWAHLPPLEASRCWALATVAVQLLDPPEWFNRWAVEDDALLYGVANACGAHDAQFFRGIDAESDGIAGIPRVVISTPELDPASA